MAMTEQAARLLARLGDRAVHLSVDPLLSAQLEGLYDRAVGRLPHRPIPRDMVVDRVADALLSTDEPPDREALARLNAPDLYLALALVAKDDRALEIAEAELMPAARQAIGRIDANPAFIDEVGQRVRERLLVGDGTSPPAIMQYRGTGPLVRWIRVIASRIALDLKRSDNRVDSESEDALAQLPAPTDPELELIWRTCADEYKAALAHAFAGLTQRERNLLRHRYIDDLNIETLGRIYHVNPATTFRWLKQIEERLAATTRTMVMTKLEISESQSHSMERLVVSQLQLSLPRILRVSGGGSTEEGSG